MELSASMQEDAVDEISTHAAFIHFPAHSGNSPAALSGISFGTAKFTSKSPLQEKSMNAIYCWGRIYFLFEGNYPFQREGAALSLKSPTTLSKISRFAWFTRWQTTTDE